MGEIKFRGIREKTGEWVFGYLVVREAPFLHDIVVPIGDASSCTWSVKRGSEGQYTGLKDKNGVEIYDGDVLRAKDGYTGLISYRSESAQFVGFNIGHKFLDEEYDTLYTTNGTFDTAEVIGNRYENPGLIKEDKA